MSRVKAPGYISERSTNPNYVPIAGFHGLALTCSELISKMSIHISIPARCLARLRRLVASPPFAKNFYHNNRWFLLLQLNRANPVGSNSSRILQRRFLELQVSARPLSHLWAAICCMSMLSKQLRWANVNMLTGQNSLMPPTFSLCFYLPKSEPNQRTRIANLGRDKLFSTSHI